MELDDLKETWRAASLDSSFELKDTLERRITAIERSGRGLRRTFIIEMGIILIIYVAFIVLVWYMADRVQSYMYKLVFVTAIAALPIAWRMYKSQKWVNSMDYSKDMRSNMVAFLQYYRLTVRLYQWSSYAITVIVLVLTFTDDAFIVQSTRVKTIFVVYLVVVLVLTEPYIRVVYGRRISVFENFLKDQDLL